MIAHKHSYTHIKTMLSLSVFDNRGLYIMAYIYELSRAKVWNSGQKHSFISLISSFFKMLQFICSQLNFSDYQVCF